MANLIVEQQTVKQLFSEKKADFLIPDYQRPYAWGEIECQRLWDDIFAFAFPNDNKDDFDVNNDEYFLGPIVTFKNGKKQEVIDGQQRLTTLMLLLRAFYSFFGNMKDLNAIKTAEDISKCIWKTDEFGNADTNALKIDSEVTSDDNKGEFLSILKTGNVADNQKSRYAENYRFFQERIDEFLHQYPGYFAYLPNRIMNNCILLPIEAESQDTALRIFSTLNDRGKPLADTDIFKAQFYKFYSDQGRKEEFVKRWKNLESLCDDIFTSSTGSSMDELFTRYMYYERAKQSNRNTTTEALRKFYEKDNYALLKNDQTLCNLESLAKFWKSVYLQDDTIFSDRVLKKMSVLQYAPNGMWTYFVSVYFMQYRDKEGLLDEKQFFNFLNKITAFIWGYSVLRPGVNALRGPVYPEMINLVNNQPLHFSKLDAYAVRNALENYAFSNQRPITKSILAWWAYEDKNQILIPQNVVLEVEHIYPRKRQENEKGLKDRNNLESIGNKALLEKNININASDCRFSDKKKYYLGFTTDKGKIKQGTINAELKDLAENLNDFTEESIIARKKRIIDSFMNYMREMDLLNG